MDRVTFDKDYDPQDPITLKVALYTLAHVSVYDI